jgi:asparagine synthase (glutamine-hydrolysing)
MCGIAGIVSALPEGTELRQAARTAARQLAHRGPDDHGDWNDAHCGLAHRRLAIIDLSPEAVQPLSNEDGSVWITFNGEIYNYQSLRRELVGLGHQFRTRTDTEVVVHAYEEWGTDCLPKLRGMFAFGLWDTRARRLFLARDRVGKRPLVYATLGDRIAFASELQALATFPNFARDIDSDALDLYLAWGYVPAPWSVFANARKLQAGHWLTVEVRDTHLHIEEREYWSLPDVPPLRLSLHEASEQLKSVLEEAVRLRLVSDVPLGAFLSGGLDSSIVVGMMARASSQPVRTFSVGYADPEFDERPFAAAVADRWRTDHHELVVGPEAVEELPRLARHFGEPFADDAALPTFVLAGLARGSVAVALNGDGGDEAFLGYERYLANRLAASLARVPGLMPAASRLVHNGTVLDGFPAFRRMSRFLAAAHQPELDRYSRWMGIFHPHQRRVLRGEGAASIQPNTYGPDPARDPQPDSGALWMHRLLLSALQKDRALAVNAVEFKSYLPYDLLPKVDITCMAHGLEARSPFLDHRVLEFAARLPAGLRLRGPRGKFLPRHAFRDLLPPQTSRRRKMGFGVPLRGWFRGPLRDLLCDLLGKSHAAEAGWVYQRPITALISEHLSGKTDRSRQLWSLLFLETWYREVLEGAAPVPAR